MSQVPGHHTFVRNQLPAILWALLIFGLSSIPGPKMPEFAFEIPDKVEHASVFFFLSLFVYRAFRYQQRYPWLSTYSLLISLALTVVYGALDETHQIFVPGRDPDVFDFLADGTGAALFVALEHILRIWKARRVTPKDLSNL